jgi:hypothetical protein
MRGFNNYCTLVLVEKDYGDHHEENQQVECELRGNNLNGTSFKMVRIKGIENKWLKRNKIKSCATKLFVADFIIDDETNELVIPRNQALKVSIEVFP